MITLKMVGDDLETFHKRTDEADTDAGTQQCCGKTKLYEDIL